MLTLVRGPDAANVEKAKELCEDLIANVKEQYEEFKARPPRYNDRGGHHGGDRYRGGHDRHHDRGNHSSYGGHGSEQNAATNSPAQGTDSTGQNFADYQAAYAQYYGGSDPYAAYGGYAKYVVSNQTVFHMTSPAMLTTFQLRRHVPAVLCSGSGTSRSTGICVASSAPPK